MGTPTPVTIFPRDPAHRLRGPDLAALLDRFAERVIALGGGAHARVQVGTFTEEADTFLDLAAAIDRGREHGQARCDLDVRLWGRTQPDYARFVGARTAAARFQAFVLPQPTGAKLCAGCGEPLDASGRKLVCAHGCAKAKPLPETAHACWRLILEANGSKGLGERFVNESRRLTGTAFFFALEGTARTPLYEWHG